MESIVEDVEDQRQTEGCPANAQSCEDSGGCDGVGISISVYDVDGVSSCGHYQCYHRQTTKNEKNENMIYNLF